MPDDADEAAYLPQAGPGDGESAESAAPRSPAPAERLPELAELVAKVPPHLAALLDDLFRAKFTKVRPVSEMAPAGPSTSSS